MVHRRPDALIREAHKFVPILWFDPPAPHTIDVPSILDIDSASFCIWRALQQVNLLLLDQLALAHEERLRGLSRCEVSIAHDDEYISHALADQPVKHADHPMSVTLQAWP
eukprot:COSAG02_NODE_24555_length_684_cov_1.340171_2_plen_109_part_01